MLKAQIALTRLSIWSCCSGTAASTGSSEYTAGRDQVSTRRSGRLLPPLPTGLLDLENERSMIARNWRRFRDDRQGKLNPTGRKIPKPDYTLSGGYLMPDGSLSQSTYVSALRHAALVESRTYNAEIAEASAIVAAEKP
jgi:hypothetical protein